MRNSPKFLHRLACPGGSWCPVVLVCDPGAQTALQLLAVPLITLCLTRRIRRKGLNFDSASAVPAHRREKQLYPFGTGVVFHTHSNPSANLLGLHSPQAAPRGRAGSRALPFPSLPSPAARWVPMEVMELNFAAPAPALGCCHSPGPFGGFSPPLSLLPIPAGQSSTFGISESCRRLSVSSCLGLQLLTAWPRAADICWNCSTHPGISGGGFKHSGSTRAQHPPQSPPKAPRRGICCVNAKAAGIAWLEGRASFAQQTCQLEQARWHPCSWVKDLHDSPASICLRYRAGHIQHPPAELRRQSGVSSLPLRLLAGGCFAF